MNSLPIIGRKLAGLEASSAAEPLEITALLLRNDGLIPAGIEQMDQERVLTGISYA